jgi:hypothetical protein
MAIELSSRRSTVSAAIVPAPVIPIPAPEAVSVKPPFRRLVVFTGKL